METIQVTRNIPPRPRTLSQDEALILEPEEQLGFLQQEMDRTMPKFVLPVTLR